MDDVTRWKIKLKKDPSLAQIFADDLRENKHPFTGDHAAIFRAIESMLGVAEGDINFQEIDSDRLVQMIHNHL